MHIYWLNSYKKQNKKHKQDHLYEWTLNEEVEMTLQVPSCIQQDHEKISMIFIHEDDRVRY